MVKGEVGRRGREKCKGRAKSRGGWGGPVEVETKRVGHAENIALIVHNWYCVSGTQKCIGGGAV